MKMLVVFVFVVLSPVLFSGNPWDNGSDYGDSGYNHFLQEAERNCFAFGHVSGGVNHITANNDVEFMEDCKDEETSDDLEIVESELESFDGLVGFLGRQSKRLNDLCVPMERIHQKGSFNFLFHGHGVDNLVDKHSAALGKLCKLHMFLRMILQKLEKNPIMWLAIKIDIYGDIERSALSIRNGLEWWINSAKVSFACLRSQENGVRRNGFANRRHKLMTNTVMGKAEQIYTKLLRKLVMAVRMANTNLRNNDRQALKNNPEVGMKILMRLSSSITALTKK